MESGGAAGEARAGPAGGSGPSSVGEHPSGTGQILEPQESAASPDPERERRERAERMAQAAEK